MAMLTVVGDKLAKKGQEFVYLGSLSECKDCKVKNICFHLEKGQRYKVVGVRDVNHDCEIHENGVKVVEVEKTTTNAVLLKKLAIDGSTITFDLLKCNNLGCENHILCFPLGVKSGTKFKIVKTGRKLKCPKGFEIVRVTLE